MSKKKENRGGSGRKQGAKKKKIVKETIAVRVHPNTKKMLFKRFTKKERSRIVEVAILKYIKQLEEKDETKKN